jgi:hypothetical protein
MGLSAKWTRWAVLLVLTPALVTAPSAAACVDGADSACCCSNKGGCPAPARPDAQRAACCDSPAAPPPAAGATGPVDPPPATEASEDAPVTVRLDRSDPRAPLEVRGADPPLTPLFTLHAALLI